MKKVVFVCVNNARAWTEICHVFEKEQDAKNWCLEQYRHRYREDWDKEVKEYGGTEENFIEYLTSGEAWPFTYHDIDCDSGQVNKTPRAPIFT